LNETLCQQLLVREDYDSTGNGKLFRQRAS
jgi:hypothetical protein